MDDINLLDRRLRNRVDPLRCQRTGVDRPPPDVVSEGDVSHSEDYRVVFKRRFENPCRPADHVVIVVDSTSRPEESVEYILKQTLPLTGVQ